MPKFKVYAKHGRFFRRNGILFDSTPRVIDSDALGWTPAQMAEFLSPQTMMTLRIEELPASAEVTVEDRIRLTADQAYAIGFGGRADAYRREQVIAACASLDQKQPHPLASEVILAFATGPGAPTLKENAVWIQDHRIQVTKEPRRVPVAELTKEQRFALRGMSGIRAIEVVPRGFNPSGDRKRVEEGPAADALFAELQRGAEAERDAEVAEQQRQEALLARGKAAAARR